MATRTVSGDYEAGSRVGESESQRGKIAAQGHSQVHCQMNTSPSLSAISNLLGTDLPSLDFLIYQLGFYSKTAKDKDRVGLLLWSSLCG